MASSGLSVRARTTVVATVVVTAAMVISILVFALVLRWSAESQTRSTAQTSVEQWANRVAADSPAVIAGAREELVSVTDASGHILAASRDADGLDLAGAGGFARLSDERVVVVHEPVDGTEYTVHLAFEFNDDEAQTRATALWLLVAGAPVLVLIVAVTTWGMIGRALRPVERIRAEVDAIGASGLDRRVAVPVTADEIARLAVTMNQLLQRLEDASRAQRQFVSDASHELRSPLAAIRQHAELAVDHPEAIDDVDLGAVVLEEGARLQMLVDDLLVLTTLDEVAVARSEDVDLDDLALEELARHRAGPLTMDGFGIAPARVRGDRRLLAKVTRNLVANAVHHARERVSVATTQVDGWTQLVVADDGPGVPAARREQIFERFTRLDESRARDSGGSGLGLAIVAGVVQQHGGTVQVDDAPGGGARFTVRLPGPAQP